MGSHHLIRRNLMPEKEVGFTSMTAKSKAGKIPELGIGMLGYSFMGKAHSNAFKQFRFLSEILRF